MKNLNKETIAQRIFTSHPSAKKVYVTSDGMPFLNEQQAKGHQIAINRNENKEYSIAVFDQQREVSDHDTPKTVTQLRALPHGNLVRLAEEQYTADDAKQYAEKQKLKKEVKGIDDLRKEDLVDLIINGL